MFMPSDLAAGGMSPEVARTDGCETGKSGTSSDYAHAMQALCRYADGTNSVTGVDTRKSLGELSQPLSFLALQDQDASRQTTLLQPGTQLPFVVRTIYAQASRG